MLNPLLLKDETQAISNETAPEPGSAELVKERDDSHTIFASFSTKGFALLLLWGAWGCPPWPQWDRRTTAVLTNRDV